MSARESLLQARDREDALRYAALVIADRESLNERLEGDLTQECTRTSCLEPEVHELAAMALVLLKEIDTAHEELDALGVQRTSFAGPFGDIKYEDRKLNLAGRIKCLGARGE